MLEIFNSRIEFDNYDRDGRVLGLIPKEVKSQLYAYKYPWVDQTDPEVHRRITVAPL